MNKSKKILISLFSLALIAAFAVGAFFLYLWGRSRGASDAGDFSGSEYKKEVDDLLTSLAADISKSKADYAALLDTYNSVTANLKTELAVQQQHITDSFANVKTSLQDLRTTSSVLKSSYEEDKINLQTQIAQVNQDIADISALEGDHSSEIAGLNNVKFLLETDISMLDGYISRIDVQIAQLDKLIAELTTAANEGGAA